MEFEYEFTMRNGRKVYVEGHAQIDYRCDCCDTDHIRIVSYDQILDTATGLDAARDDRTMTEIEDHTDSHVYDLLAERREEGVA